MSLTLEEFRARNVKSFQLDLFSIPRFSYDKKRQNTFRENISSKHKHEESVRSENYKGFCGDLFPVKQNDDDENVILDQQDDVLEVVHESIAISEVVQSWHRVTYDFDGQRL